MGRHRKSFFKNPENTVTFRIVQSSLHDPRNENETVPVNAFERVVPRNSLKKGRKILDVPDELLAQFTPGDFGIYETSDNPQLQDKLKESIYGKEADARIYNLTTSPLKNQNIEEALEKECYFPADDYAYEKHIKPLGEGHYIGEVEPTNIKEIKDPEGVLCKDAELKQALEDPELFEELSDDFVFLAQKNKDGSMTKLNDIELLWGKSHSKHENEDEDFEFSEADETGFDAVLQQYEEPEIGQLEESAGAIADPLTYDDIHLILDDFLMTNKSLNLLHKPIESDYMHVESNKVVLEALDPQEIERIKRYTQNLPESEASDSDSDSEVSELYNDEQPHDIMEAWAMRTTQKNLNEPNSLQILKKPQIKLDKKSGIPVEFLKVAETKIQHSNVTDTEMPILMEVNCTRKKDETTEERRERKAAIKKARQMIRQMKREKQKFQKEKAKSSAKKTINSYDASNGIRRICLS